MTAPLPAAERWSYATAFVRNAGLISPAEQARLRDCRVAIAGLGGVGGLHLVTLARLGVGRFSIADPDTFELVNVNRQHGATLQSIGHPKADVMAKLARSVNPDLDLRVLGERVSTENAGAFFEDADLFIDGIDFFEIDARRLLFREARRRGLWAVTAGPIGFSTAWLSFDPVGMSFDRYFDLSDHLDPVEKVVAFAVGLTPRATQLPYMPLAGVDFGSKTGPSASLACQLSAGVAAAESLKILLGRGPIRPAPCYFQFDAYRQILRKGRLLGGNRNPVQRLKRRWLSSRFRAAQKPSRDHEGADVCELAKKPGNTR